MRALVVEDDHDLANALKDCLIEEGIVTDISSDGDTASYVARTNSYDIIILDNILPKKNGLIVCKEIRAAGIKVPILIMSVQTEVDTKVDYLNCGADDYIPKPFALSELIARIRALTRRPYTIVDSVITIDDVTLDSINQSVTKKGKLVYMTKKEFMILEHMSKRPGQIVTRMEIMDSVWNRDTDPFSNSVETHIANIRRKIDTGKRKKIETVPGRGYRLSTKSTGTIRQAKKLVAKRKAG